MSYRLQKKTILSKYQLIFQNIVFSGGSTLFKNFDRRLERTLQKRVEERLEKYTVTSKNIKVKINFLYFILLNQPKPIKVNVTNNMAQEHVVWLGGSTFATMVYYLKLKLILLLFFNFSQILPKFFIQEKNTSKKVLHVADSIQFSDFKFMILYSRHLQKLKKLFFIFDILNLTLNREYNI